MDAVVEAAIGCRVLIVRIKLLEIGLQDLRRQIEGAEPRRVDDEAVFKREKFCGARRVLAAVQLHADILNNLHLSAEQAVDHRRFSDAGISSQHRRFFPAEIAHDIQRIILANEEQPDIRVEVVIAHLLLCLWTGEMHFGKTEGWRDLVIARKRSQLVEQQKIVAWLTNGCNDQDLVNVGDPRARDKVAARLHLCDVATLCRCVVDIKIHEVAADDVLPLLVLLFSAELTFKQFIGGIYDIEAAVLF